MATTWVYLAYPYSRGSVAAPIADLEAREAFHSLLLAYLPESYRAPTGERPAPLRLKGGVNLRLFHRSERFSEDIDFDLTPERGPQFLVQLRKLLSDTPDFRRALLAAGIEDLDTQRFGRGRERLGRLQAKGAAHPRRRAPSYKDRGVVPRGNRAWGGDCGADSGSIYRPLSARSCTGGRRISSARCYMAEIPRDLAA